MILSAPKIRANFGSHLGFHRYSKQGTRQIIHSVETPVIGTFKSEGIQMPKQVSFLYHREHHGHSSAIPTDTSKYAYLRTGAHIDICDCRPPWTDLKVFRMKN
jgi:hypothetical protein